MNWRAAFASVLAGVSLTSCTVGPKYTKPPVPAAPAFQEANGWKTAQPSDAVVRGKWWELFHDPQLNALQEQVEPANQTVKVA
jgi:outer membrane protein TolC